MVQLAKIAHMWLLQAHPRKSPHTHTTHTTPSRNARTDYCILLYTCAASHLNHSSESFTLTHAASRAANLANEISTIARMRRLFLIRLAETRRVFDECASMRALKCCAELVMFFLYVNVPMHHQLKVCCVGLSEGLGLIDSHFAMKLIAC